ncbi:unnamed protein product [Closterium sp. Naga37s-1]|nr:unnamed protein product [Closterium sp. Naga37s-1]
MLHAGQGCADGLQGCADGLQGCADGLQGCADGLQGCADGLQGCADGLQGCADGLQGCADGLQGCADGLQGCADGLQGCADGLQGCADGLQGCADGLQGCADGLQGCADGLQGCADGLQGCTGQHRDSEGSGGEGEEAGGDGRKGRQQVTERDVFGESSEEEEGDAGRKQRKGSRSPQGTPLASPVSFSSSCLAGGGDGRKVRQQVTERHVFGESSDEEEGDAGRTQRMASRSPQGTPLASPVRHSPGVPSSQSAVARVASSGMGMSRRRSRGTRRAAMTSFETSQKPSPTVPLLFPLRSSPRPSQQRHGYESEEEEQRHEWVADSASQGERPKGPPLDLDRSLFDPPAPPDKWSMGSSPSPPKGLPWTSTSLPYNVLAPLDKMVMVMATASNITGVQAAPLGSALIARLTFESIARFCPSPPLPAPHCLSPLPAICDGGDEQHSGHPASVLPPSLPLPTPPHPSPPLSTPRQMVMVMASNIMVMVMASNIVGIQAAPFDPHCPFLPLSTPLYPSGPSCAPDAPHLTFLPLSAPLYPSPPLSSPRQMVMVMASNIMVMVMASNIVGIQAAPFDPDTYEEGGPQNLIRWRHVRRPDGTMGVESNARMVRWSDGSLHLLLGAEVLATDIKSMQHDKAHLFVRHPKQGVVQGQGQLVEKMRFRPFDTHSLIHKKLTLGLDSKYRKGKELKSIVTTGDPEKEKEERERSIQQQIRTKETLRQEQEKRARKYSNQPQQRAARDREQQRYGGGYRQQVRGLPTGAALPLFTLPHSSHLFHPACVLPLPHQRSPSHDHRPAKVAKASGRGGRYSDEEDSQGERGRGGYDEGRGGRGRRVEESDDEGYGRRGGDRGRGGAEEQGGDEEDWAEERGESKKAAAWRRKRVVESDEDE